MNKTFLKHDCMANALIPALKRVNAFKVNMKVKDIRKRELCAAMIIN